MTKYTFYDEGYLYEPECDCCLPSWLSFYRSEDVNALLGPALDEEDYYIHAIKQHQGDMSYGDSYLYCMTLEELKKLTKEFGIEVEIV